MNSVKGKWCPLKSWKHERLHTQPVCVCVCVQGLPGVVPGKQRWWLHDRHTLAARENVPTLQMRNTKIIRNEVSDSAMRTKLSLGGMTANYGCDDVFLFFSSSCCRAQELFSSLGDGACQIWLFVFCLRFMVCSLLSFNVWFRTQRTRARHAFGSSLVPDFSISAVHKSLFF